MEKKYFSAIVNDNVICGNISVADDFYSRFKGLMFGGKNGRRGLLIKNCRSVHTCFMNYDIDVICLDRDFNAVKIFTALKPFRFIFPQKNTAHILEIPSNENIRPVKPGDNIKIRPADE